MKNSMHSGLRFIIRVVNTDFKLQPAEDRQLFKVINRNGPALLLLINLYFLGRKKQNRGKLRRIAE